MRTVTRLLSVATTAVGLLGLCAGCSYRAHAAGAQQTVTTAAAPDAPATPGAARTPGRKLSPEEQAILRKILVSLEAEPDEGPAPLTVQFSVDFYYEKDTANPQFTWYFGDGSPLSHQANPRHTYKQPGTYKVSVRVTDAEGRAGTDDWSIDVESPDE